MELAARPGSPIRRLVLNDFGARIPVAALQRIGRYLRTAHAFATLAEVEAYLREIYAPFGDLTDAQWRHMAVHGVVQDPTGLRLHYDPAIVEQFSRPLLLDVVLWRVWEHVACRSAHPARRRFRPPAARDRRGDEAPRHRRRARPRASRSRSKAAATRRR